MLGRYYQPSGRLDSGPEILEVGELANTSTRDLAPFVLHRQNAAFHPADNTKDMPCNSYKRSLPYKLRFSCI